MDTMDPWEILWTMQAMGMLRSVTETSQAGINAYETIQSVFLNPFNSHQYVLAYRGGRKKSSMPGDWADNVHF